MNTSLTTSQSTALDQFGAQPLDRNPAATYLASLPSPGSRRTMASSLNKLARMLGTEPAYIEEPPSEDRRRRTRREVTYLFCKWEDLRFQHTSALRAKLADQCSPKTASKDLSALRRVLEQAWRLELMSREEYARAADLKGITGETLPAGRSVPTGELLAIMSECGNDPTPAGARDAAIIAVLYSGGLRRAELVGLDLANYDAEAGELRVLGKRRKERIVPVVNGTVHALADWLSVRGDDPGALFLPIRKGGHMQHGERLTTEAVWHMLKRREKAAGIKDLSPHDFRRTFVSDLLDAGADIATVQRLAGHANIQTTARYDRRPEAAKRKAAELLHVPYARRRLAV